MGEGAWANAPETRELLGMTGECQVARGRMARGRVGASTWQGGYSTYQVSLSLAGRERPRARLLLRWLRIPRGRLQVPGEAGADRGQGHLGGLMPS